ncbi:penicillin acylase family protein [Streptomyces sp. bgisy159]|uniref:penicillin acylase family protein n=1 Tax=Streptomyces sp. bgisy159 TaxID=3413795 RepID=UPI003F49F20F
MTFGIYRDTWGIPHLRAADALTLAYAQGLVTARDRAWQLEVERHRAQGTSASFLGAEAVSWDVLARRARLADTARTCFDTLRRDDPETADWLRSYVDGVNAGLAAMAAGGPADSDDPAVSAVPASREPTRFRPPIASTEPSVAPPPEFARTGLTPGSWEPWTPLAVWLSAHILFAGFPAKLWREQAVRHLGPEAVGLFATDGPGTAGSNGWLVSGERTVTGHAVIAGDPHRFIEDPGVYQQIRLACDDPDDRFDVVGLAVPGVPGIAHFGHTGGVAWAITNAMADYQDLYRERLRRTGAGVEALGPDGVWRRATRTTELVHVAGEAPVEIELVETERGPVIAGGPEGPPEDDDGCALSLRYPPRVTGDLGFGALLPLLRARRVADVDRALDAWVEPVNVVQAADTEGGLLHRVAGRVPVRAGRNRVRPVPAWRPGHEWTGWHEMPRAGLTDGIAVMANQRGPAAPLGVEFAPPHRADRIRALLDERRRWSAADMPALHTDTHLASAAPLLDRIAGLTGLSPAATALRDRLLRWDRRMDADSEDAAAFAAVRGAVVRRLAAHPAFGALTDPPACPEVLLPWLALLPRIGFALEHLLGAEELYGVDRDLAVREAVEEAALRSSARWGDTHRLAPWRALPDPSYEAPALSGDHDCVLCTSAVPGLTDLAARGPAARYVWDLARREDSRWVVPLGAHGTPGHPHHRDQLPLWLRGELAPIVTDWALLQKESDVRP